MRWLERHTGWRRDGIHLNVLPSQTCVSGSCRVYTDVRLEQGVARRRRTRLSPDRQPRTSTPSHRVRQAAGRVLTSVGSARPFVAAGPTCVGRRAGSERARREIAMTRRCLVGLVIDDGPMGSALRGPHCTRRGAGDVCWTPPAGSDRTHHGWARPGGSREHRSHWVPAAGVDRRRPSPPQSSPSRASGAGRWTWPPRPTPARGASL